GAIGDEVTAAIERVSVESGLLVQRLDAVADQSLDDLSTRSRQLRTTLLVLLAGSAVTGITMGVLARRHSVTRRVVTARDKDSARRSAFGNRLQRGLEMTRDEEEVFGLMAAAVAQAVPAAGVEVLLADSSRAHFRRLHSNGDPAPDCGVASPADCPAVSSGRTEIFRDGVALDACPRLRGRTDSAVCVPLSVAGRTTGVIHVSSSQATAPNASAINDLELIARGGSERLAMVRAFETTSIEANTDALTGLANRRAMQRRLRAMEQQGQQYCLAFGDLDHFKLLNDRHGHDVGDRALRAFAMMLIDAVGPDDLAVRYGGEEFIVVFPDRDLDEAEIALHAMRARLAELLHAGSIPAFTVSFGLAASERGKPFDQVIAAADGALLSAKAGGRDGVLRAEPDGVGAQAAAHRRTVPALALESR
ncbi:MAG: diguanylate cyclase domain-containing protein, partial [Mycobacterium sp.]